MARECLFCDNKADSVEHVWPGWLMDALDPSRDTLTRARRGPGATPTEFAGDITARAVCRQCNNGWMSHLEGRAKPILLQMLFGDGFSLSPEQGAVVATWTSKTAMLFDFLRMEHQRHFEHDAREYVRAHDFPPPETRVWMGCLSKSVYPQADGKGIALVPRNGAAANSPLRATVSTLVLGRLVLQGLFPKCEPTRFATSASDAQFLALLWPNDGGHRRWPPAGRVEVASDESFRQQLESLSTRFKRA